ncbi:WhiB family transcriptional regulator [Ornithinimicrobium faecis]|uniref:WhiB family transcriptional regulator n=1 Tax=Ornithinimicrobium faecis TaxID=2934158 RepID=UPI003CE5C407
MTPCRGLNAWTSEDAAERAVAARACQGCEVLALCGAAAGSTRERYGVYAGVDRTPRVGAPPKTTTTTRRTA